MPLGQLGLVERKLFLCLRVVQPWERQQRGGSPVSLERFKTELDKVLSSLLYVELALPRAEGWTRGLQTSCPPQAFSNL